MARPLWARKHVLHLWVTAKCGGACPQCSQQSLMRLNPDYDMSIAEVDSVISACRESGYLPFNRVCIEGGDGLLWRHLEGGLGRLHGAGVGPIRLFTNGLARQAAIPCARYVRELVVSRYKWNGDAVMWLRKHYPGKMRVLDMRGRHFVLPRESLGDDVLPARCVGLGYLVYDGYVYACCNMPATGVGAGYALADLPRSRLQAGFIDDAMDSRAHLGSLCARCIGNVRVQRRIPKHGQTR